MPTFLTGTLLRDPSSDTCFKNGKLNPSSPVPVNGTAAVCLYKNATRCFVTLARFMTYVLM